MAVQSRCRVIPLYARSVLCAVCGTRFHVDGAVVDIGDGEQVDGGEHLEMMCPDCVAAGREGALERNAALVEECYRDAASIALRGKHVERIAEWPTAKQIEQTRNESLSNWFAGRSALELLYADTTDMVSN